MYYHENQYEIHLYIHVKMTNIPLIVNLYGFGIRVEILAYSYLFCYYYKLLGFVRKTRVNSDDDLS